MAKKHVLVMIGGLHHPFEAFGRFAQARLEGTGRFRVTVSEDRNLLKAARLKAFDAVMVYTQGGKLTREQEAGLTGFVLDGGAFIGVHCATASWRENKAYTDMVGCVFKSHGPVMAFPVQVHEVDSRITARIGDFRITDELYVVKGFDAKDVELLASCHWRGGMQPIAYTKRYGEGRVFYLALGHDERAFNHAAFGKMLVRGLDWALGKGQPKRIKAGCIGYGPSFDIARLHLESMTKAGFDVVAACDLRRERREAAEREWPGIATYASAGQMLKRSDAELVAVCTEHNVHAKLALQCLKAGRHVVTEKPFCITTKEADAMIAAAKTARRMLSVFHNRRWDGDYMTIKDVIGRGLLGEVFQIELCGGNYGHPSYWWRSDKKISGGAFYDWGAHFVDWVLGLTEAKVTEVSGHFVEKAVWHDVTNEDHCQAQVRFANGCGATVELSSLAAIEKPRWRILGTQGALLDLGDNRCRVVSHRDGVRMDSTVEYLKSDWHAYYANVADHLYFGEPLAVTPESARRVIAVIETAEKSSRQGKALPPPKHCA